MVIKEDVVDYESEMGAPYDAVPVFLKKASEAGFALGFYTPGNRCFYKRKNGRLAHELIQNCLIENNGYLFFPSKQKAPGIYQINSIRTEDAIGI